MKKRYSSVMEKIIKNAVSETSKVLETIIAELKAEVKRVKSENENLQIRCSQFEEVVKKRSVYRETGTSPEPWIIEKCDKAVQCDFIFQHSDEDPNLSDNETHSESSFGFMYEKESSSDSFSFTKPKDIEGSPYNPLDLSNRTTPEKAVADYDKNMTDSIPVDKCCLAPAPQVGNMESKNALDSPTQSLEQENVPTVPHDEHHKEFDTRYETSEMEIEENVCVDYAETDQSLLVCQEDEQKGLVENENRSLQKDICVSTEMEDIICEIPKAQVRECKSSASSSNAPQETREETIEMVVEYEQQSALDSKMETGDSSTTDITDAELGNTFEKVDVSADVCRPPDQALTLSDDMISTDVRIESEQTCTGMCETTVQSVSTEDMGAKGQNTLQPVLPPKSQYFLRRQRCTSVTLEDAMLLLDAVNQQKYKSSSPKKLQTKDSSKNVATQKLVKIQEVADLAGDSSNFEEIQGTTEPLQPQATTSSSTRETTETLDLDVCAANLDIDGQQHQETNEPSEPHLSVEAVSTQIKHKNSTQVTEADSASLNIEDQHDQKILSPATVSIVDTENTTPNLIPAKLDETLQTPDANTPNMDIEERHETTACPATPSLDEPPKDVSMTLVVQATSKLDGLSEIEEVDSHQHDSKSLSATPPSKLSSVQSDEGDNTEYLSTPAGNREPVTPDHLTPKDSELMEVDVTPSISASPSEPLEQTASDPTVQTPIESNEFVAQISGHSPQDSSESQENDHKDASSPPITSALLNLPAQHTMVVQLPGDSGGQSSSIVKAITSTSALSPAQLSAVVSAVRSTQSKTSPASPSVVASSSKKAFVAVPFSLQSVMRPHHKIIVIPRQCKVPTSQAIAKDKAVVLKQKAFSTETTTTFISTTDVNLETASDDTSTKDSMDQPQTTSVTTTTQALSETSPTKSEPSPSGPVESPCKNTVQIKLNRIQIPVSPAQPVVTETAIDETPKLIVRKKRGRPPLKKNIEAASQPKAQQKENDIPSPITGPSPNLSSKETTPTKSSRKENATSTVVNQSPTPEQLSPVVAADHSYPQHRMTKSQFLAKLEVSPVTEISKKADVIEKDAQKASLVDRLRSHLKPHIKTTKKAQKTEPGQEGLNVTVDTKDHISTMIEDTPKSNQGKSVENVLLPSPVPHNVEIRTVTPKASSAPKNTSANVQVKRKRSPKRNLTPTKTVKKSQLKGEESNEDLLSGRKMSPMRSKIINSNALLSCVRKGIKKKSFLCKFCRKEFSKKKDIEIHIQVHVGKKPFQCNICHRRFSRTMELSRHLKRHNAEKKYQCTSCGKAFIEYNNLKRHTYIHTGEKPFTCPHCPRAFTQSGHMRTHIRNNHKDIEGF